MYPRYTYIDTYIDILHMYMYIFHINHIYRSYGTYARTSNFFDRLGLLGLSDTPNEIESGLVLLVRTAI